MFSFDATHGVMSNFASPLILINPQTLSVVIGFSESVDYFKKQLKAFIYQGFFF